MGIIELRMLEHKVCVRMVDGAAGWLLHNDETSGFSYLPHTINPLSLPITTRVGRNRPSNICIHVKYMYSGTVKGRCMGHGPHYGLQSESLGYAL